VPGLGAAGARQHDWRRWRWPLRLAVLAIIVNVAGLNIEWLRMRSEANAIRQSMAQTFRTAYPNQPAIEPVAQMRQNIARAKTSAGQVAPGEFTWLAAAFGEAVRSLGRQPAIASMEYRERALNVKLKPEAVDPALIKQLKSTLSARNLSLEEPAPATWRIRSTGATQ